MKIQALLLLAALAHLGAASNLRNLVNDKEKDKAPKDRFAGEVVGEVELEGGKVQFIAAMDTILVSAYTEEETKTEFIKRVEEAQKEKDPEKAYKKLTGGKEAPGKLKEKNRNKGKNPPKEGKPPSGNKKDKPKNDDKDKRLLSGYDLEIPAPANNEEDHEDKDDRQLLNCGGHPNYPVGSRDWWRYWSCSKSGSLINDNECSCYTYITNDYSPSWIYDNDIDFYVYPYRGGVYQQLDWWNNGAWTFLIGKYVSQGVYWHLWVTPNGHNYYLKPRTKWASGDGYHFAHYSKHGSLACTNSCGTHCDTCEKRNF